MKKVITLVITLALIAVVINIPTIVHDVIAMTRTGFIYEAVDVEKVEC